MKGQGIVCIGCGSGDLRVVDSRANGNCVYRRRRCNACGARFSTAEEPVSEMTKRGPGGGVVTRSEEITKAIEAFTTAFARMVELTSGARNDTP